MEKDFTPSSYQLAIFDYIQNEKGNLVIEACAGSGKTSTILKSLLYIPADKQVLLAAFNNDIVQELKKRTKEMPNVTAQTCHSLGLSILKSTLSNDFALELCPYKYNAYIKANLRHLTPVNTYSLGHNFKKYCENISTLVDLGRAYLCKTLKDILNVSDKYGIETIADEADVAFNVMKWGKENLNTIDFTDMIWLPNIMNLPSSGFLYDFIYIDEAQDLNKAQRELILKCRKEDTRIISAGDQNQCLYTFNGADPDSFSELKAIPNTISLPLSITYRCADNIVEYAQKLVPTIEKNTDGRKGIIEYDSSIDDALPGDMILCRNNAPLAKIYNQLIKNGKNAVIRGKDIGSGLLLLIDSMKQKTIGSPYLGDGLLTRLYAYLFETRDKIMRKEGIDEKMALESPFVANLLDSIRTIEVLSDGINDVETLREKIKSIFGDKIKRKKDEETPIYLSTIHKAKGLEADNVFIACPSLMPSKRAKLKWEIQQEYNLMYVAYTRAKNKLSFLDESDFSDFDIYSAAGVNVLKTIEAQVNRILHGKKIPIDNIKTAQTVVANATAIKQPVKKPIIMKSLQKGSDDLEKKANDILRSFGKKTAKKKKWF